MLYTGFSLSLKFDAFPNIGYLLISGRTAVPPVEPLTNVVSNEPST